MSVGVRVEMSERGMELIRRYGNVSGMLDAVRVRLDLENQLTLGEIKEKRLTGEGGGPFPPSEHRLNRRSNKLVASSRATDCKIAGNTVWGTIGASVRYAILHEEGWDGTVAPHTRQQSSNRILLGKETVTKKGNPTRKRVSVTARGKDVFVGGYKMHIPKRAPFITGVRDRLPATAEGISEAIVAFYEDEQ